MTLTEAAIFFKKSFKLVALALVGLVIFWMLAAYAISTFQRLNPTQETPTVRFGKLPKLTLPEGSSKNLSFVLDTIDGRFPLLPKVLPVYEFSTPTPNLLDLDRSKDLANNFGFISEPKATDSQNYVFTDPRTPYQEFRINAVTKNFSLVTTDFAHPELAKTPPSNSVDEIISAARSILKSRGLLPKDLEKSEATVSYKKIAGSSLVPASSISEANYARVDIFREGVADYPLVGPKKDESLVYLVLSSGRQERTSITELGYTYWSFFIDGSSSYPIRDVANAWEALRSGEAVLISPANPSFSEVRIKNINIGYFESPSYQPYLQPVFLFDGVGVPQSGPEVPVRLYLPAVDPSYLSQ